MHIAHITYYYAQGSGVPALGLTTPDGRGITTPDGEQITTL